MLSEEALVLFAAIGACALLILGMLELMMPSRPRRVGVRTAPPRDPWRRAQSGPPPTRTVVPALPGDAGTAEEPPIERLLRAEAATLPSQTTERGSLVAPLPPPREPTGFGSVSRHPVMPQAPEPQAGLPAPRAWTTAAVEPAPEAEPVAAPEPVLPPESARVIEAEPGFQPAGGPLAKPALEADAVVGLGRSMPPEAAEPRATADRLDLAESSRGLAVADARPVEAGGAAPEPVRAPEPVNASTKGFVVTDTMVGLDAAMTASGPAGAQSPPREDEHGQSGPSSVVDHCYVLYEARQYAEALDAVVPALKSVSGGTLGLDVRETARLWGLAGLAHQALGHHDDAREAFEEAVTVAPEEERPTWQRHLGSLALHVGEQLVAHAQGGSADAEGRIGALRTAITWLERGQRAAPADAALCEAAVNARLKLWPTYEQACGELIQRQEYTLARDLLREALGDQDCPAQSQATLRDLVGMTYSGEVGQLTAEAIRRMQEGKEEDAVATLDRAEALLTTIPGDGLSDKRRQELERRLWWSYTKVGMRRLDGGMFEEALGPLLHALHFGSVGPERLEETKRPLTRALESVAEVRSPLIQRLAAEGDREGALVLCEKLWSFLRGALDRGMTREELATAFNRTQTLFEKLGKPRR